MFWCQTIERRVVWEKLKSTEYYCDICCQKIDGHHAPFSGDEFIFLLEQENLYGKAHRPKAPRITRASIIKGKETIDIYEENTLATWLASKN